MSSKLYCSLCLTPSNEYEPLQNDEGDFNDIYEITIKYFDPLLLKTDEENEKYLQSSKLLCRNCWIPIKEFSEFHQNVIRSRSVLERTFVKVEYNDQKNADENHKNSNDLYDGDNYAYSCENVFVKPDLDFKTDNDEQQFTSDEDNVDEKPIIILKSNTESKKTNLRDKKLEQSKSEDIAEHKTIDTDQDCSQKKKLKLNGSKKDKDKSLLIREKDSVYDGFIAEWKPILECDLCEETSSSFGKLRSHFQEQHKTRCYIKCCERKFYRRHLLVNHIQLHLNPETHKCDICGKVSTCKSNLKIHKKLMHEHSEQLECEICHKIFSQKPYLDRHLLTHVTGEKKFACQECGKAYVLEVQLKSHVKTVHNVDRICDQCGKTVHGVQALKMHLMEHAGIKKTKFPCDECGVELNSRSSLKRHKAALHHDGSTVYVCSICSKVFANANALTSHKKLVHVKDRKFKCTFCEKAFKTPKVLREHIASHTGQDLYQCPHCPQTFKVSSNMHHHRKKVHPVEWEEGRKNRLQAPKVDINHVKNQVVL